MLKSKMTEVNIVDDEYMVVDKPQGYVDEEGNVGEPGIELHLPVGFNLNAVVFMTDKVAQQLVDIIQNKINARLK
jgi:hypothetical protein